MSNKPDKYAALWISYSSLSDFLACPRLYYLANVYKNPKTGRKITIMKPPLALGAAVHAVLDQLSNIATDKRFEVPLIDRFEKAWEKTSGKKGGFKNKTEEDEYKKRGIEMLNRVSDNPGPLARKALKIQQDLPFYWISEKDNIILCGKLDWLEYLEDDDAVHIIDFKTGKRDEKKDSLQLPIYYLLAVNCQSRTVKHMSYWYLDRDSEPKNMELPDKEESHNKIMKVAGRMKLAKQLNHFKCGTDGKKGCFACAPYEAIIAGNGEFVGVGGYNREVYILPDDAVSL